MSDYIKGLKKQTKELEKLREPLLKKIKELKEQFKEKHKIRSAFPTTGITRKLKAKWTIEAQQDLGAMHNVNVNKTLTDMLAEEIRREIDNEVINDMQKTHYKTTKRSRRRSRK